MYGYPQLPCGRSRCQHGLNHPPTLKALTGEAKELMDQVGIPAVPGEDDNEREDGEGQKPTTEGGTDVEL